MGAYLEFFCYILVVQPMEVFVDDETKLTLHGLQQYYCKLKDSEKNRKLFDLLDVLEFNQVGLPLSRKSSQNMNIRSHSACNPSTACFLSGGDLCQVSASLRGSVSATGGAEFPRHCHPQGHGSGRAVGASSSSVFSQLKHHLVEKSC